MLEPTGRGFAAHGARPDEGGEGPLRRRCGLVYGRRGEGPCHGEHGLPSARQERAGILVFRNQVVSWRRVLGYQTPGNTNRITQNAENNLMSD